MSVSTNSRHEVTEEQAAEIAADAYTYAYPLVLMEVTRRVMTNCETPDSEGGSHAPVNQFAHVRSFPDASFTDVVRANADTLYSAMFFDVSKEPLIVRVPDSAGRFYLLQMMDAWTDVFASPGIRTTGPRALNFAITGPRWQGKLPDGVDEIRSPTATGWMLGRTQTNGKADYDSVHKFQAGIGATPLSLWGREYVPPRGKLDSTLDMGAPVEQVKKMEASAFFQVFSEATKSNPPHANDYPILARMARIGLEPGKPANFGKFASIAGKSATEALPRILTHLVKSGKVVNGWQIATSPIGTYGTDYTQRATIAYFGLGANVSEDAIYPSAMADAEGKPYDSAIQYLIHFDKNQIPPVNAFWSITMYNERQFFAANAIDRYAIGDRDKLAFNPDGSLDIYVQRERPGGGERVELAAGARCGNVHDDHAIVLAEACGARRDLGTSAGAATG